MQNRQTVGQSGEARVAGYLEAQGYRILARNFRIHQQGEIDIIVQKDEYIACVEVKTRYSTTVPFTQLVPRSKQQKIIQAARHFVQKFSLHNYVVRFDVAFVDMTQKPVAIEYIDNAFQV